MKHDIDLPRDYITNTVYHSVGTVPFIADTDWQNHADQVLAAYCGGVDDPDFTMLNAQCGIEVKVYDMGDAVPRPVKAVSVNELWLTGSDPANSGPPQVAVCLSYFAGRNLKHLRGHIYIGPINKSDCGRRPASGLRGVILDLGHALWNVGGTNVTHVLYRPTTHDTADITDYWVGDSWSVQRRRALKPTARVTAHP